MQIVHKNSASNPREEASVAHPRALAWSGPSMDELVETDAGTGSYGPNGVMFGMP